MFPWQLGQKILELFREGIEDPEGKDIPRIANTLGYDSESESYNSRITNLANVSIKGSSQVERVESSQFVVSGESVRLIDEIDMEDISPVAVSYFIPFFHGTSRDIEVVWKGARDPGLDSEAWAELAEEFTTDDDAASIGEGIVISENSGEPIRDWEEDWDSVSDEDYSHLHTVRLPVFGTDCLQLLLVNKSGADATFRRALRTIYYV